MPKTVGHAISIVGALVIGESAVTAGIVSAPMIIVVGLTAVSSFVVSTLYEPVAVLRFAFIIIGGLSGLYGIMLSLMI
jgi:spore germination protein KA